jgi:hypothetical protein
MKEGRRLLVETGCPPGNARDASMSLVIYFSKLQGKRNQYMEMHTSKPALLPGIREP